MIFIIHIYDSLFSTLRLQVLQVQQELLMPQGVSQERISYERRKGSVGTLGDTAILSTKLFLGLLTFLFQGLL